MCQLADEGVRLQKQLQSWYNRTMKNSEHPDPHMKLALANYHSLQLFLCRNYSYYSCWEGKTLPTLTREEIIAHITAIVTLSNEILENSDIPGAVLLFPLRMVGANVTKASERVEVLRLLDRISQKGFIVSKRIRVDVQEIWKYQELSSSHGK